MHSLNDGRKQSKASKRNLSQRHPGRNHDKARKQTARTTPRGTKPASNLFPLTLPVELTPRKKAGSGKPHPPLACGPQQSRARYNSTLSVLPCLALPWGPWLGGYYSYNYSYGYSYLRRGEGYAGYERAVDLLYLRALG